jgi:type II restriction/modification system DNA methylase subunit YeeA
VLRKLDTIQCRDAVLNADGTAATWPKANAMIGNPPFLGDKAMIGGLGAAYVGNLRRAYEGRVPGGADLVCYWFEKGREALEAGDTERVGLVSTNSIRGGANRHVLDRICEGGVIYEALSCEPWTLDGAAVRVSLVCFAATSPGACMLNGATVPAIHSDLTSGAADLTLARPLAENAGVAVQGPTKGGKFEVDGATARKWLREPPNANGGTNSDVLKPWCSGDDVTGRWRDKWLIDFHEMPEAEAAYYSAPYTHVVNEVKPARMLVARERRRRLWWQYNEVAPGLRRGLAKVTRFVATPEVSKHRLFVWLPTTVLPDKNVVVILRDDDTSFGILQSRFHMAWALRLGTSLEDRPRYTSTSTFRTFPFPDGLTPDVDPSSYAADPLATKIAAAAQNLVAARNRWLNPSTLINVVPEVVPGFPDRLVPKDAAAAARLRPRTLTNLYITRGTALGKWLDTLHATLDDAVAEAYGWPPGISDNEAMERLLALNIARPRSA